MLHALEARVKRIEATFERIEATFERIDPPPKASQAVPEVQDC
ncbi:MAG TPA: hypothetical protein VFW34_10730 [Candidatus Rubrimentiphilum sp.]|nr:hypothetical protein [Candidatus Rubrimentiphilum sp.]